MSLEDRVALEIGRLLMRALKAEALLARQGEEIAAIKGDLAALQEELGVETVEEPADAET